MKAPSSARNRLSWSSNLLTCVLLGGVGILVDPRGNAVSFAYKDFMRIPIHVDDIAEVFVRVLLADAPRYHIYNSGGTPISLGELADLVRTFIPAAQIHFEHEQGGKESSGNYLIDNRRLVEEFEVEYPPFEQRVKQIIDEVRQEEAN